MPQSIRGGRRDGRPSAAGRRGHRRNHRAEASGDRADRPPTSAAARADAVHRFTLPAKRWWFRANTFLRRLWIDADILHRLQVRWLTGVVRRSGAQIIHSHLLKADRVAGEVKAGFEGRRHVVTLHGDYAPFLAGQADAQMLKVEDRMLRIIREADALVGVCREHVDFAVRQAATPNKVQLIYNGYSPPHPLTTRTRVEVGLPEGKFLIGTVSRGVEGKGWSVAVEALRLLRRDDVALLLVGEGPAIDALRHAGLPHNLVLAGFSANPPELIRHFDLCLLPTRFPHESLPTAVMEYLFCAKAVIATDVGEIRTMLTAPDGESAGVTIPLASPEAMSRDLAAATLRYLDDPALLARHAAAAPLAFAKFDMRHCTSAYEALYARLDDLPASA